MVGPTTPRSPRSWDNRLRLGVILAAMLVALLAIGAVGWIYVVGRSDSTTPTSVNLAAVDVAFTGSGANAASETGANDYAGQPYEVGTSFFLEFTVQIPDSSLSCTNPTDTYSITQVAGPATGAFLLDGVKWAYPVGDSSGSGLPAQLPGCYNSEAVDGLEVECTVAILDAEPSIQTLELTVTINQLS